MSSGSIINEVALAPAAAKSRPKSVGASHSAAWHVLKAIGSLKITVTMFALAILILFVGTLAQDEQTLVDVKKIYFNSWVALVPHHVFLPVTIFGPHGEGGVLIPMPGGATIGLILLINLIAAKFTRFSMQARGAPAWIGSALVAAGLGLTVYVILNAHVENGLQGEPPFSYRTLWLGTVGSVYAAIVGMVGWLIFRTPRTRLMQRVLVAAIGLLVGLAVFFAYYQIPDPGLRIVWQLFKSLIAGVIMLLGLNLLFGKRGGNVLIHLAVGLLMLGQFVFGDRQDEEMILLQPGETTNMAFRADEVELAVIETFPDGRERHVAIDEDMLTANAGQGKALASDLLPFDLRVDRYLVNSELASAAPGEPNPATTGLGGRLVARQLQSVGGASQGRNFASAYVSLIDKETRQAIDTILVSQELNDAAQVLVKTRPDRLETVEVGGKQYQVALRSRRTYKPYDITLDRVQQVVYSGTGKTQDYSSYVKLHDRETDKALEGRIWMNNPMRFDGETFYQSQYYPASMVGRETTGLQVVTNAGWMMPYLACVFAGLGMFVHFGQTFVRFAGRFDREVAAAHSGTLALHDTNAYPDRVTAAKPAAGKIASQAQLANGRQPRGRWSWVLPVVVVTIVGIFLASAMRPKAAKSGAVDWYRVGQIPMQNEGRLMPLDSVARRFLQTLSGATYTVIRSNPDAEDATLRKGRKVTAVEFFFALANGGELAREAKVFRIDAPELRELLDLDPQASGGDDRLLMGKSLRHRYSFNQIRPKLDTFSREADRVRELVAPVSQGGKGMERGELEFFEGKIAELHSQLNLYLVMADAYSATPLPRVPEDFEGDYFEELKSRLAPLAKQMRAIEESGIAGMIPPKGEAAGQGAEDTWRALNPAAFDLQLQRFAMSLPGGEAAADENPAVLSALKVFGEAAGGTPRDVDQAVAAHLKTVDEVSGKSVKLGKIAFESWYNAFNPFVQSIAYYSIAIVLVLLSFLFARQPLRRAAFWTIATVFVVHTLAIVSRIYISERPPVVNLYSSAVYIGWAAVLAGLVIERIYPIRLGVLVGGAVGVLTLLVAWGLDTSDTMPVLEAVLDTQFWLTTHVQCITLGYAATFFAGFIALYALAHRAFALRKAEGSPQRASLMGEQRILYKLCYGVVCFGLFFSFIGTVLGGLWADDSWGRFWGWDPKENGALMIVLWNALLLHARWDKLVLERGFYLLAIGGNIMTAWSWFGTNQLGIGLHSYGFTSSVLIILALFVASQLAAIVAGAWFTRGGSEAGSVST